MSAGIPDKYSFAAWQLYCKQNVRFRHSHDPEQLARLDRLLMPETERAWKNLAGDVNSKARSYSLTWPEALHQVIGTIVFPPSAPDPLGPGWRGMGIPLLPATRKGANAQRNWVALYVKTWIIPDCFNRKHYEEIAALVEIAWGSDKGFTADQVRLLRPFHFRKR